METKELKIPQLEQLIRLGRIERDVKLALILDGEESTTWSAKVKSLTSLEQQEALMVLAEYQNYGPLVYEAMYRKEMLARCIVSLNDYRFENYEQARLFFDSLQDQLVRYIYERCVQQIIEEQSKIVIEAYLATGDAQVKKTLEEIANEEIANPVDVVKNLYEEDSGTVTTESSYEDTTNS